MNKSKSAADRVATAEPMVKRALLSALGFVGRINSSNPPNEFDRIQSLKAVQDAVREIDPAAVSDPYFGQFFK